MARKRTRVSHGKEIFYIVCILVVLLVALLGYFGPSGYRDMEKSQMELETRKARVEALTRKNNERMHSVYTLRNDKQAQERYARQKGYAKKGEIIQEVPSQDPTPAPVKG